METIADSEAEILKVIWAIKAPMTGRHIRDALVRDFDWRKTSVQTLIKRLVEKGALLQEKKGVYIYTPTVKQEEFEQARTVDFLNRVFGGNAKNLVSTMPNGDILSDQDMGDLKDYWQKWKERMRNK